MPAEYLDEQLNQYESQYSQVDDQVEAAQLPQAESTLLTLVEEGIQTGLSIVDSIDYRNNQFIEGVRTGQVDFKWYKAAQIARRYQSWLQITEPFLDIVSFTQGHGYSFRGARDLQLAYDRVASMSLDTARVRRSIESTSAQSHEGIMRGIRDRLQCRVPESKR